MGNWDKPWMIGGGVEHSVEVARLLASLAANGGEGVASPTDLRVSALASPGPAVQVAPGACVIQNRVPGALKGDAYAARLPVTDTVPIAAAGGTPRYDMIVARIEDPFMPGSGFTQPPAAELQTRDYCTTAVIPNVSATATTLSEAGVSGMAAIPLARVYMPANASTVQPANVTSLRRLYNAQSQTDTEVVRAVTAQNLTTTAWATWPTEIIGIPFSVPYWATHMSIAVTLGNVNHGAPGNNNGNGWKTEGNLRVVFVVGSTSVGPGPTTAYNLFTDANYDRAVLMSGFRRLAVPPAIQGRNGVVYLQAQQLASANAGLRWDAASMATVDVIWHQEA